MGKNQAEAHINRNLKKGNGSGQDILSSTGLESTGNQEKRMP
jgi:hypothetical protein